MVVTVVFHNLKTELMTTTTWGQLAKMLTAIFEPGSRWQFIGHPNKETLRIVHPSTTTVYDAYFKAVVNPSMTQYGKKDVIEVYFRIREVESGQVVHSYCYDVNDPDFVALCKAFASRIGDAQEYDFKTEQHLRGQREVDFKKLLSL